MQKRNEFPALIALMIALVTLLLLHMPAMAEPLDSTPPSGRSLIQPGIKVRITLDAQACYVISGGTRVSPDARPENFHIDLVCGKCKQRLWTWDGDLWDEPSLKVLGAGDFDRDGRIDLDMELSPKYSMVGRVLFLSSKAEKGQLVGVAAHGRDVEEFHLKTTPPEPDADRKASREFIEKVRDCLRQRDVECLASHVAAETYFPEFNDFGCIIQDLKRRDESMISAGEFAGCVMTSTKESESGPTVTLYKALDQCFNSPQPLTTIEEAIGGTIAPARGYGCSVTKTDGTFRLSGVQAGC